MRRYEVTAQCYVPVGAKLQHKRPGQVVVLDDDAAAELAGFVTPLDGSAPKGVAKRNTPPVTKKSDAPPKIVFADEVSKPIENLIERVAPELEEEVDSDAGEPGAVDERAAGEAVE